MAVFFIADTHFGHAGALGLHRRLMPAYAIAHYISSRDTLSGGRVGRVVA